MDNNKPNRFSRYINSAPSDVGSTEQPQAKTQEPVQRQPSQVSNKNSATKPKNQAILNLKSGDFWTS
jgi:hypothetical protein